MAETVAALEYFVHESIGSHPDAAQIDADALRTTADAICPHARHTRFWRSKIGKHLVCGTCHPPVGEHVVAQWIKIDGRLPTHIDRMSEGEKQR